VIPGAYELTVYDMIWYVQYNWLN